MALRQETRSIYGVEAFLHICAESEKDRNPTAKEAALGWATTTIDQSSAFPLFVGHRGTP